MFGDLGIDTAAFDCVGCKIPNNTYPVPPDPEPSIPPTPPPITPPSGGNDTKPSENITEIAGCARQDTTSGLCLECNQQSLLAAEGSLCECEFNYTLIAEHSAIEGQFEYGFNNFLTYTDDVVQNGTAFLCSDLFKADVAANVTGNLTQIGEDFASLECVINIYKYVRYDRESWKNELRIINVSAALD